LHNFFARFFLKLGNCLVEQVYDFLFAFL
jgi:hypothetical protein